jgi:hypothetical protein
MKLKKKFNKSFKVLELDGGGMLGTMFLIVLAKLEEALGAKCCDIFDLMIGTSTGGISGAMLATGVSASDVLNLYRVHNKKIFKKRPLWFLNPAFYITGSRYKRKYIDDLCDKMLGDVRMEKTKSILIVTSVNMYDSRSTHFFKSYKPKYKNVRVSDCVKATYSAPTYFGYFKDTDNKLKALRPGVWSDGGVGVQNCTLEEAYIECLRLKERNHWILSCGCGYTSLDYESDNSLLDQIADFIPIAREQAVQSQIRRCGKEGLGVNFYRVDGRIPKKHNKMDGVEFFDKFVEYGESWAKEHLPNIIEGYY